VVVGTIGTVHRIEVDGVPVFTASGPERVSAALVFGVGIRDESYATLGITHLVEHLVMAALPKSHLECNAMVDVDTTTFMATGRPDAVAAFLEGVCRALTALPTHRIPLETGVLQAENCPGAHPTAAVLWGARFRLAGPGLTVAGGGVPGALTENQVLAHVRRWFVRRNAALVWHGPGPEGLRLPLPEGWRMVRPVPRPRRQTGPVWTTGPTAGVGLLVRSEGVADAALDVALDVLEERVRDLARHQRGLSYAIESAAVDTGDARDLAVLVDARNGQEAEVARVLWDAYRGLVERAPTWAEVAHAVGGRLESADGGAEAVAAELGRAALDELSDRPVRSSADVMAAWQQVTPRRAAAALRATLPTAILAVPEDVELRGLGGGIDRRPLCDVAPVLPAGAVFGAPPVARLLARSRRRLVVSDRVLAEADDDGAVHVLPWADVEAVEPSADGRGMLVVGRNLCTVDVHEDRYGRRAVAAVRAHLPRELWLPGAAAPAPVPPPAVPAGVVAPRRAPAAAAGQVRSERVPTPV
jgi:hypothetical protein